jgi:hypothetical protein
MLEVKLDLAQIFALEVKVFYNTSVDFWRMTLDLEEVKNKHIRDKKWVVKDGQRANMCVPLHLDKYRLLLMLQYVIIITIY